MLRRKSKRTSEQVKASSCSADAKAVSSMALFHRSKSDQTRPDGNLDHDERTIDAQHDAIGSPGLRHAAMMKAGILIIKNKSMYQASS